MNNRLFHDICISDFSFIISGHGHYKVIYTSPKTRKTRETVTSNMPLIDRTKNSESPKRIDLIHLKSLCKK